jgi:hypothetical protein
VSIAVVDLDVIPDAPIHPGTDTTGPLAGIEVRCSGSTGTESRYWIVNEGAAVAVVDPLVLRDIAQARITIPDPSVGSNPPFNEPGRFGVVQMPVWFWLEDPWEELGPETETVGAVTVAVAARPVTVTWATGDNGQVVCDGPGVAWRAGLPEDATDCSYTYTSSSADEPDATYALSATVTWEFEWWINGASQGVFGTLDATTPFTYQVGEIQATES